MLSPAAAPAIHLQCPQSITPMTHELRSSQLLIGVHAGKLTMPLLMAGQPNRFHERVDGFGAAVSFLQTSPLQMSAWLL